jgi:hypothetical protein
MLTESFHASSPEMPPEGWVPATHPGGALYFYNPKWVCQFLIR